MRTKKSVGLRALAVFDAAKGGIVPLLAGGLPNLVHETLNANGRRRAVWLSGLSFSVDDGLVCGR
ncbi:MAG TPA: hypothetical protein VNH18_05020 [Bryobacteraceae bacterium]|nr:hypothetical protein [Bryobacteraceae bacterium]